MTRAAVTHSTPPHRWLHGFWFGPVDAVRLVTFQRAFALTFLLYMLSRFWYAGEWLTDDGYHLTVETNLWSKPDPMPLLPARALPWFGLVLFGSTLALIVDWHARKFVWLTLACAVYVQSADLLSAFSLNKIYIAGFAVLALAPTRRCAPDGTTKVLSAWPIRTLQATLLIQYFTAGMCKIRHGEWFEHTDVLWTHVQGVYCTDLAAWMLRALPIGAWAILMYGALAFEVLSPVLFCVRRIRWLGMLWGAVFQLTIAATMHHLIYFSLQLLAFYVLFVDADVLRRLGRMECYKSGHRAS